MTKSRDFQYFYVKRNQIGQNREGLRGTVLRENVIIRQIERRNDRIFLTPALVLKEEAQMALPWWNRGSVDVGHRNQKSNVNSY